MEMGEVRQGVGGTGKASGSEMNAREREKADYSSPQNLGEKIHVKIVTIPGDVCKRE